MAAAEEARVAAAVVRAMAAVAMAAAAAVAAVEMGRHGTCASASTQW